MKSYGLIGNDDLEESITWRYAYINVKNKEFENYTLDNSERAFLFSSKRFLKDLEQSNKWDCPKNCYGECKKSFSNKDDLLRHELVCFNISKIDDSTLFKSIECEKCGKQFLDKGQKMNPKYLLNRHYKKCKFNTRKNIITNIHKKIDLMDDDELKLLLNFINKKNEINYSHHFEETHKRTLTPEPPLSPTIVVPGETKPPNSITMTISPQPILDEEDLERPKSNVSVETNSSLEDWEYQAEHYWIDNKNRVYDRTEIYLGKRFMNDWENWEIEFEEDIIKY